MYGGTVTIHISIPFFSRNTLCNDASESKRVSEDAAGSKRVPINTSGPKRAASDAGPNASPLIHLSQNVLLVMHRSNPSLLMHLGPNVL